MQCELARTSTKYDPLPLDLLDDRQFEYFFVKLCDTLNVLDVKDDPFDRNVHFANFASGSRKPINPSPYAGHILDVVFEHNPNRPAEPRLAR